MKPLTLNLFGLAFLAIGAVALIWGKAENGHFWIGVGIAYGLVSSIVDAIERNPRG